ncbi:MAG TPA: DUF1963 domain-containing protein [Polyangiaceae bacterium]|nr:DUF1963 domain-containing protein [Polyangiaceae bacterium]
MFIKQGLNPFTRGPLDLFNWGLLEPYVEYHSTGVSIAKSKQRRRSWLGGEPEFVDVWPQGRSAPLPFVCQLDLAELSQGANAKQWPGLPRTGVLSLFYDESSREYDSANFSVSFDAGDSARTAEGSAASRSYQRAWLQPTPKVASKAPRHRIGGTPLWIQAPDAAPGYFRSGAYITNPELLSVLHSAGIARDAFHGSYENLLAAGRQLDASGVDSSVFGKSLSGWTLLFQIDADPRIGLKLGSLGRLYVFGDPKSFVPGTQPAVWVELQYS